MNTMEIKTLGCGRELKIGHKCGVANAWGKEYLCDDCESKMKEGWKKDEQRWKQEREKYLNNKGGIK